MVRCELAAGTDNPHQAKDQGVDPTGGTPKAVAAADNGSDNQRGTVDSELKDGNAASSVELCASRHRVVIAMWLSVESWESNAGVSC